MVKYTNAGEGFGCYGATILLICLVLQLVKTSGTMLDLANLDKYLDETSISYGYICVLAEGPVLGFGQYFSFTPIVA